MKAHATGTIANCIRFRVYRELKNRKIQVTFDFMATHVLDDPSYQHSDLSASKNIDQQLQDGQALCQLYVLPVNSTPRPRCSW
jgi:hypothetical protein